MKQTMPRISPSVKIGQFLFKACEPSENLHSLWTEAKLEAASSKTKFIVLLANFKSQDCEKISLKLKDNLPWLKNNAFLSTKSRNLLVFNLQFVRKYGDPGSQGFSDFIDWMVNKVKSEGHQLAHIVESEFLSGVGKKKSTDKKSWYGDLKATEAKLKEDAPKEEMLEESKQTTD